MTFKIYPAWLQREQRREVWRQRGVYLLHAAGYLLGCFVVWCFLAAVFSR